MALAWPLDARAEPPRIVVIDVAPRKLPVPHDKTDLANEIARAIDVAGCKVVRTCRAADCRTPTVEDAGAHLLSFEGRYEPSRFTCGISVEVRHPASGVADYRDHASNPVCPAAQLVKDTREAGQRACDALKLRAPPVVTVKPPPVSGPPAKVAAAAGTFPPLGEPTAQVQTPAWNARAWLGPALIIVGAGVGIIGGIQASQHNEQTRCEVSNVGERVCTHMKKRPIALPLLLAGAASIGWGIWEFTVHRSQFPDEGLVMLTAGSRF